MRTLTITLSKTEFEERDGKVYYKELRREYSGDCHRAPAWEGRFLALRDEGLTYAAIADQLNAEGFKSKHGKKITIDHLRNRAWYLNKKG